MSEIFYELIDFARQAQLNNENAFDLIPSGDPSFSRREIRKIMEFHRIRWGIQTESAYEFNERLMVWYNSARQIADDAFGCGLTATIAPASRSDEPFVSMLCRYRRRRLNDHLGATEYGG